MLQAEIGKLIIDEALRFINLYEVKSNAVWQSILDPSKGKEEGKELVQAMHAVGWKEGLPYCIGFAESMWRNAYIKAKAPQTIIDKFSREISLSVMQTYNTCKAQVTKNPLPGSIFLMQHGNTGNGHAGIVVAVSGTVIATIEGNTSPGKAVSVDMDRNGDGVYRKTRTLSFARTGGMHLLGFLNPPAW